MGVVIALVILDVLALAVAVAAVLAVIKLGSLISTAEATLNEIRKELPPTVEAAKSTLRQVQSLASEAEAKLDSVDAVLKSANRLISGEMITDAAVSAIKTSSGTLGAVVSGLTQGIRLWKSRKDSKREDEGNV